MEVGRRRAALAVVLRELRDKRGMTQGQVASFLGCTQSKIAKIERANAYVKPRDLKQLVRLYRPDAEQFRQIKELAAVPGPALTGTGGQANPAYLLLLDKERQADEILALHSERVPAPLQSDTYRLRQYRRAEDPTPLGELLLSRDDRAEIFTAPERRTRYRVLLSESALYRLPGGRTPELANDQASYLYTLMESYDRLLLQIVPFTADIPFLDADFTVLKFSDPSQDFAYADNSLDAQTIQGKPRIADREKYWYLVQRAALSVEDSRKFLRRLIDDTRDDLAPG